MNDVFSAGNWQEADGKMSWGQLTDYDEARIDNLEESLMDFYQKRNVYVRDRTHDNETYGPVRKLISILMESPIYLTLSLRERQSLLERLAGSYRFL